MKVVDTSVAVAGFATWHEAHASCRDVLDTGARITTHGAAEVFSVLTRLPPPHKAPGAVVGAYLERQFAEPWLPLGEDEYRQLLRTLSDAGLVGGRVYDAIIGATAHRHGATLFTLDSRASEVYAHLDVDYVLVS